MMVQDSCVSWAVLTILVMAFLIRLVCEGIREKEQYKEEEHRINYDQDLIF